MTSPERRLLPNPVAEHERMSPLNEGFPLAPRARTRNELAARLGWPFELLLPHIGFDPMRDLVVASGSIIEGLGNTLSDLDIFILTPGEPPRRGSVWYWKSASLWVDEEWHTEESVSRVIEAVHRNGGSVPAEWGLHKAVLLGDADLYHRLSIGVALNDPLERGFELARFDRELLAREFALVHVVPCRARWLDAVGCLHAEQYVQAWCSARIAYEHAVDAYASLLGETNPGPKWRWARVARLAFDPLGVLSHFSDPPPSDLGSARDAAEAMLVQASELLFQVMNCFVYGHFVTYAHDLRPDERYELHRGQVIRVDGHGKGHRIDRAFAPLPEAK